MKQEGSMDVEEIVKTWLKEHGYDGLCDPETECGCSVNGLMPCMEGFAVCQAGHKEKAPRNADVDYFIISPGEWKAEG